MATAAQKKIFVIPRLLYIKFGKIRQLINRTFFLDKIIKFSYFYDNFF